MITLVFENNEKEIGRFPISPESFRQDQNYPSELKFYMQKHVEVEGRNFQFNFSVNVPKILAKNWGIEGV